MCWVGSMNEVFVVLFGKMQNEVRKAPRDMRKYYWQMATGMGLLLF